jgi:hypothetical protein
MHDGAEWRCLASSVEVNDNDWHYAAATWDGTTVRLYLDGSQVDSKSGGNLRTDLTRDMTIGAFFGDKSYEYQGHLDEFAVWDEALNASQISDIYSHGNNHYRLDEIGVSGPVNLSNIVCTSPTPDDDTTPYSTKITTPTFTFDSNKNAWCKISNDDLNYSAMSVNCTTGEGSQNHTCTLGSADELPTVGTDYVHISCTDGSLEHNSSTNFDLEMDIIAQNETEARAVIASTISATLTSPVIYSSQQLFLRYLDSTQVLTRFDKVAYEDSQYWAFNYITSGEDNDTIDDMGSVLSVWQNWSLTQGQIENQVEAVLS